MVDAAVRTVRRRSSGSRLSTSTGTSSASSREWSESVTTVVEPWVLEEGGLKVGGGILACLGPSMVYDGETGEGRQGRREGEATGACGYV